MEPLHQLERLVIGTAAYFVHWELDFLHFSPHYGDFVAVVIVCNNLSGLLSD